MYLISNKRGVFLSTVITLQSFDLFRGLLTIPSHTVSSPSQLPFSPFDFKLMLVVVSLVLFWEIWFWKKWAIYAKFILDGLAVISYFFLINSLTASSQMGSAIVATIIIALIYLIEDGLLYWAVKRKWKYFS